MALITKEANYLCGTFSLNVSSASPALLHFFYSSRKRRDININPLNTKRRLLYLKTQFVPRSKHFSSVIKTNQFML